MLKRTMFVAVVALCAGQVTAAPFGDGFAGTDLSAYLVNAKQVKPEQVALQASPGSTGKKVLKVAGGAQAVFVEVPVDANTKYTLTLRARLEGGEAVEENPHLDIFAAYGGVPASIASRESQFLDADRKPLGGFASGLIVRDWFEYRDIFYPPARAAFLRLVIKPGTGGATAYIDDPKLEKTPDEGAINPNPVIGKYGKYNYSGWGAPAAGGKIIQTPEGRIAFDTKYGTRSASFPLPGPGAYEVTAKSEENGYNYAIVFDIFDENNKRIGGINAWGNGKPYRVVVPPEGKRASFLLYSNFLDEIRVNRAAEQTAPAAPAK